MQENIVVELLQKWEQQVCQNKHTSNRLDWLLLPGTFKWEKKRTKEHIQNASHTLLTIVSKKGQGEALRPGQNFNIEISRELFRIENDHE